jgi:folate-binding protein YgfZ
MDHQYRIITAGAGWIDRSPRGMLRFDGPDARRFLQALLTNDVDRLSSGGGLYACYLTPQGRMIGDLDLFSRGDVILASVAAGLAAPLAARFDALIFSEDMTVSDVSAQWTEIGVTGGAAAELLGRALDVSSEALQSLAELAHIDWHAGFVARGGDSTLPMFRVFLPVAERLSTVGRFEAVGIGRVSDDLATALRIEAGRALWGTDLSGDVIPLEAGLLDRAISTTKGCYVGQEIVIRILHRGGGRVARRLVRLAIDPSGVEVPEAGAPIAIDGHDTGHVTSAAFSPASGRIVALGYVHRDAAEPGRVVAIGPGQIPAEIVGLAG